MILGIRVRSLLAAATLIAMLPSCARIVHPERVGNRSGVVDVGPLVVDLLLFIPGLIPGVIAIAVDFGSGAIYVRNDVGELEDAGLRFALVSGGDGGHEIHVFDDDGRVVARGDIDLAEVETGATLTLQPVARTLEPAAQGSGVLALAPTQER